jgi:type IV secretory pathway VirB3-like protein
MDLEDFKSAIKSKTMPKNKCKKDEKYNAKTKKCEKDLTQNNNNSGSSILFIITMLIIAVIIYLIFRSIVYIMIFILIIVIIRAIIYKTNEEFQL